MLIVEGYLDKCGEIKMIGLTIDFPSTVLHDPHFYHDSSAL